MLCETTRDINIWRVASRNGASKLQNNALLTRHGVTKEFKLFVSKLTTIPFLTSRIIYEVGGLETIEAGLEGFYCIMGDTFVNEIIYKIVKGKPK